MHYCENERNQILQKFYRCTYGLTFNGSECWVLMDAPIIRIDTAKICFLEGLQDAELQNKNAVNIIEKN
jgi:hypothetical protein